jgi:hypothetical protein
MNLDAAWSFILEVIGEIIIPSWNDLIAYIPLLIVLLVIVSVAGLAWYWQRNAAGNRSRVPRPVPSGRLPDGVHMPGPSAWPFVAPIGLLLMVFALAFGILDSLANLTLLATGAAIAIVGALGWYLDANRELARVEAGAHHPPVGGSPAAQLAPPSWSLRPPAGLHLPSPSAWPFLAPVGLLFMVAGLIFGPAMLIGGLVMAVIAALGWLLDADRELADVEAHGHPTQGDRDPEKAWPRRLMPVYVLVGGVAVLVTLAPWLLSLLPGSG